MEVELSEPYEWSRRGELPPVPGVYVISKAGVGIIYIGMTNASEGLRSRVTLFHRAATTGRAKHSGGRTFHRFYGIETTDLTVQVHRAPRIAAPIIAAYIEFVERSLIWDFAQRHGHLPVCNAK
ncbi:MAG: hypothetical protein KDK08_00145 [Rhizobiaceae bacterium]|nr:hypothetical protein [Rhizobiaceae bacterium]